MDTAVQFLSILSNASRSKRILLRYKLAQSKDKKSSSETDKPWETPGQSSQQPEKKGPPKRERTYEDNETA